MKGPQSTPTERKAYPSDVTDEEWAFVQPYLALIREDASQREHHLREVFNALRWVVRSGSPWRYLPTNFPPWAAVYQQTRRWMKAGCFEDMVDDLCAMLREAAGKKAQPSAVVLDAQTVPGTLESGPRAGYDGHKKKNGSKAHVAVDTLGLLLAVVVTPADEQEREQVGELCRQVQAVTGDQVELAWAGARVRLEVVRLPEAKKGFVLLPRKWVVERSFSRKTRFRRMVRDYERLPETVEGLHFVVFACLMLTRLLASPAWGS